MMRRSLKILWEPVELVEDGGDDSCCRALKELQSLEGFVVEAKEE